MMERFTFQKQSNDDFEIVTAAKRTLYNFISAETLSKDSL